MARGSLPEMTPRKPFLGPSEFDWIWFLFKIHGRVPRRDLWLRLVLPVFVIQFVLVSIDIAVGGFNPESQIGTLSGIFSALTVWPGIAVTIKRLHDRDRSGWFMLIALIPFIGPLWLFVETGFLAGTQGPNRFGAERRPD